MNRRLLLISIIVGAFIYYRKLDYYKTMPRESITVSALISIWTYFSMKNPIYIILGLLTLNIFGAKREF